MPASSMRSVVLKKNVSPRPPGDGVADLLGIEMQVVDPGTFERYSQFDTNGASADDSNLGSRELFVRHSNYYILVGSEIADKISR